MKKFPFLYTIMATVVVFCAGCDREATKVAEFDLATDNKAFIKVNYSSAYQKNPAVQLKLNDVRVSNSFIYSYPFPGGGLNTQGGSDPLFFPVEPGALKVGFSIPNVGKNTDSLPVFNTSVNLEAGKYYTLHISDTAANTQATLMMENVAMPDTGVSRYKFINLMPDAAGLDLYFDSVLVAGNIPYKGASPEFNLSRFTDATRWEIRLAGALPTSTPLATYPTTATTYSVPNRRVLNVYARGYRSITSTTDVRRPQLSLYYVR